MRRGCYAAGCTEMQWGLPTFEPESWLCASGILKQAAYVGVNDLGFGQEGVHVDVVERRGEARHQSEGRQPAQDQERGVTEHPVKGFASLTKGLASEWGMQYAKNDFGKITIFRRHFLFGYSY